MKEAKSYFIKVEMMSTMVILRLPKEIMVRKVETTTKVIYWNDLIDDISLKVFINGNKILKDQNAIVDEKIRRSSQKDGLELSNKKKP